MKRTSNKIYFSQQTTILNDTVFYSVVWMNLD